MNEPSEANLSTATTAPARPVYDHNRFEFDARLGTIYRIWFLNLALGILTLGIYHFWGKTRMRLYLTHSYQLLGDRFEYRGTGKELFIGFLKALPFLIAIAAISAIWPPEKYPLTNLIAPLYFVLYYAATYAAMRYRMSRITWRGIRGRLTGSAFAYAGIRIACVIGKFLSLGLATPWLDLAVYRYRVEHSYFGNVQAKFDGSVRGLLKTHFITWLLILPTLGLSRFWYKAALIRHQLGYTIIYNLRLRGQHTASKYFSLYSLNFLLMLVTFGLGFPIVLRRNAAFFAENVSIVGNINTDAIRQSDEALGNSGEGLESAMGIDAGFL